MPNITDITEGLRGEYLQKYGFAVFDLESREGKTQVVISGKVLTASQKDEVLAVAAGAYGKKKIKDKITVLSDPKGKEVGWAVVRAEVADLKSRFVDNRVMNEKILGRIRVSQYVKGEVLRVLLEEGDQFLVQSEDLTTGWMDRKDVILKKTSLRKLWRQGVIAEAGKLFTIKIPVKNLIDEAERFLGAKYVLGARSEDAIDCSGFVQCSYKNAFGIILPKHSWDQKKMGVGVDFDKAVTGDLIFMINKKLDTKHVGIFESSENGGNIIHASSVERKVVRQNARKVFDDYYFAGARRIVKSTDSR